MILTLCLLLLVGLVSLVESATYYVNQSAGNNGNPCTPGGTGSAARQTINEGIRCLASGDTLLIGPGTYDEQVTDYNNLMGYTVAIPSGGSSWETATTLRAENPGTTTVITTNPGDNSFIILLDNNHYIIIDGLIIDGQFNIADTIGIGGNGAHHLRFVNLEIKNALTQGIRGSGFGHQFLNLYMHNIAINYSGQRICPSSTCDNPPGQVCVGYCHGIYLGSPGHAMDDMLLDGGIYEDIDSHVAHFYTTNSTVRNAYMKNIGAAAGFYIGGASNNRAYNNVIHNVILGFKMVGSDHTIAHNTVCPSQLHPLGGDQYFLYQQSDPTPATIKNNLFLQGNHVVGQGYIFINDGAGNNALASGSPSQVSGNICDRAGELGCSIIPASPSPVANCAAGDLHLTSTSAAIGQSASLGATYTPDKDNNPRPTSGAVDTGAYQFATGGGPVAVALQFLQQPSTAVVGSVITPAITVRVIDQSGNLFTGSSYVVTLTLGTNPGGAQLLGTPQITTVSGVATFSDIQVTIIGEGYQLHASNPFLTDVLSNGFNILPPPEPATSAHISTGHFLVR